MVSSKARQPEFAAWLAKSGLQCASGPDCGAVHAWIDEAAGRPSFLYTEATGYLITLLANLAAKEPHEDYRQRAISAAQWLVSVAKQPDGTLLTRKYCGPDRSDIFDFRNGVAAFFDTCVAAYGLLNVQKLTGNDQHWEDVTQIAERSLDMFFSDDLELRAVLFDSISRQPLPAGPRWSGHGGSFTVKAAMLYASLHHATGDRRFRRVAEKLAANALRRQTTLGRFITSESDSNTHLHPHCYTIEGLLYLSQHYAREDLFEAAVRALDFAFSCFLEPETAIRQSWPSPDRYCGTSLRSDVVAQCLRAYYIAKLIEPGFAPEWERDLSMLHELMDSFLLESGGTSFGFDADGALIAHANSWCHFFRLELELFRDCYHRRCGFPGGALSIT
jgi:hypothetical protein